MESFISSLIVNSTNFFLPETINIIQGVKLNYHCNQIIAPERYCFMNEILQVTLVGLTAGVIGTGSGGAIALILKNPRNELLSFILGFSGGIMLAIVLTDLLPEAVALGRLKTAALGVLLGAVLIFFLDLYLPVFQEMSNAPGFVRFIRTGTMLGLGIAMHNLPEGIAMGAGYIRSPTLGLALALTFALHNIPEGVAMAGPLHAGGLPAGRIFFYTALAGMPEGIGAFIGASFSSISPLVLSLALSFAGGAMLYIIFSELIPGAQKLSEGYEGTFGAVFGSLVGIVILVLI